MSLPHNISIQLEFISACIAYFSFIAERINAWQLIRVEYSAIRTCLSLLGLSLLSFRFPKCVTSARRKSGFRGQKFSFRGGTSASDRAFLIATKVRLREARGATKVRRRAYLQVSGRGAEFCVRVCCPGCWREAINAHAHC